MPNYIVHRYQCFVREGGEAMVAFALLGRYCSVVHRTPVEMITA